MQLNAGDLLEVQITWWSKNEPQTNLAIYLKEVHEANKEKLLLIEMTYKYVKQGQKNTYQKHGKLTLRATKCRSCILHQSDFKRRRHAYVTTLQMPVDWTPAHQFTAPNPHPLTVIAKYKVRANSSLKLLKSSSWNSTGYRGKLHYVGIPYPLYVIYGRIVSHKYSDINCQTFIIPSKLAQAEIDIGLSWR